MRSILLSLLAAALVPAFTSSAIAGPPAVDTKGAVSVAESAWSSTLLGAGVKTNDVYTDGNIFLTVPIWSTIGTDGTLGGNYLFIEPYSSVGTGGEVAASLGFSYRHLFSNEPVAALQKKGVAGFMEEGWFVGASFFVDMLDTQHRNSFWQLGVGAEIGNRYVELRGNYYIPLTDRKLAEHDENVQNFQSSSSSTSLSQQQSFGNLKAKNNEIDQQVNTTTFATTTTRTTTTTVRTVTEIFEKGMEGWDAELSLLVPWVDQWVDLKVIGGYFSFDNQPFGPQEFGTGKVHGWKAGVEVRPVPAVVLSGTWYEDKRLTGGNWTVGAQLQVPLDKTWKDSFKLRRRHLVEHLAEPVHRQNDAVKIGNDQEQHVTTTSHTSVKKVTEVVSQSSTNIVLKDKLIFVHNGATDVGNGIKAHGAVETGTAQQPFDLIQEGANVAQANSNTSGKVWSVYTQGTPGGYSESVAATVGSVNFIGSGRKIHGLGGKDFGTGPAPTVAGGFRGSNIGFFGLTAYNINTGLSGPDLDGIRLLDVARFRIDGANITNVGADGIDIRSTAGTSTGTILGSTITHSGDKGMELDARSGSGLNITLLNNNFVNGTGDDVDATSRDNLTTFVLNAGGNTFSGGSNDAFSVVSRDGSSMTFTGSGNNILNTGDDGFYFESRNGSNLVANVFGNQIFNVADDGVDARSNHTSTLTLTINGNVFSGAGNNYIATASFNSSTLIDVETGNTFSSANGDASRSESWDSSTINYTSIGNFISNQLGHGVHLLTNGSSNMVGVVIGNTIINSLQDGINASAMNTTPNTGMNLTIADNTISGGQDGIAVKTFNNATTDATLENNSISGTSFEGIHFYSNSASKLNAGVNGNTIDTSGLNNIETEVLDSAAVVLTVHKNNLLRAGLGGICLDMDGGTLNATISKNFIDLAEWQGIEVMVNNSAVLTGLFKENLITRIGSGGSGVDMAINSPGLNDVTIQDNTIKQTTGNGIVANVSGNLTTSITGNKISDVDNHGISLLSIGATAVLNATSISNNTIDTTVNGNGMDFYASLGGQIAANDVSNNSILNVGNEGVHLHTFDSSSIAAVFANNKVLNPNASGFLAVSADASTQNVTFTGNTVTGGLGDGIGVGPEGSSAMTAFIISNTINKADGNRGVAAVAIGGSLNVQVTGNNITGGGQSGINFATEAGTTLTGTLFDNNTVSNYGTNGVEVNENGGTLNLDGTLNVIFSNTVGAPTGGNRLQSFGSPAGSFFLNGVQVNLPATVP